MNITTERKVYKVMSDTAKVSVSVQTKRYVLKHERTLVGQTTYDQVIGETPSGTLNGSNVTFTTAYNFIPETVQVLVNGLEQKRVRDFNTTGNNTILLTEPPYSGETILVHYSKVA